HDPDNALYDYLAALSFWKRGAAMRSFGGRRRLVVHDEALFARGMAAFEQGQQATSLRYVESDETLITALVERSCLLPSERASILGKHYGIQMTGVWISRWLVWQDYREDANGLRGTLERRLAQ